MWNFISKNKIKVLFTNLSSAIILNYHYDTYGLWLLVAEHFSVVFGAMIIFDHLARLNWMGRSNNATATLCIQNTNQMMRRNGAHSMKQRMLYVKWFATVAIAVWIFFWIGMVFFFFRRYQTPAFRIHEIARDCVLCCSSYCRLNSGLRTS